MARLYPPTDPRHWKGVQRYEIERCDSLGIQSDYYVNEISVYEDLFPELVAESITKLGIIRSGSPEIDPRKLSLHDNFGIPKRTDTGKEN